MALSLIYLIAACTLTVAVVRTAQYYRFRTTSGGIHNLHGLSFLIAWGFFTRRYDFMWSNFKKTGSKMFRFRILRHSVVAITGERARKIFFTQQGLNLAQGYRVLMGRAPRLSDIEIEDPVTERKLSLRFISQLLNLIRAERINQHLPILFEDIHRRTKDWGAEGTLNPFDEVYDLVFQMTVRWATCRELSEDKEAISKLSHYYKQLDDTTTPLTLVFPWFPSKEKRVKQQATWELYELLSRYVKTRRDAERSTSDAIDILMADGESDNAIIGVRYHPHFMGTSMDNWKFILGAIYAGVLNAGMNVCWNLLYLGLHPEWKKKVAEEVQALLNKHTGSFTRFVSGPSAPLYQRFASIPMASWEDSMPVLDSVMRETLRLISTGTMLRRNLGNDIHIDDSCIAKGEYLAFSSAEVHHNPEIYTEPLLFDPGRYNEGKAEDKKVPFAYVAWGAGRRPCPGMKLAKLEMKMVIAFVFAQYDFEIVDSSGKVPVVLPRPDKNDLQWARPSGEPYLLKFKHRQNDSSRAG